MAGLLYEMKLLAYWRCLFMEVFACSYKGQKKKKRVFFDIKPKIRGRSSGRNSRDAKSKGKIL